MNNEVVSARDLWIEEHGARLFARELGSGRAVVFLHGGLADHRGALFRVNGLARTHRLICPDLRGSGRSIDAMPLHWDRLADDVAAWLRHLEIDRAVVGGTSMGAGVALRFALRHPQHLRGLILMSPLYPGADRPLPKAAEVAMRLMDEAAQRALERGIEALEPLFGRLPADVREVALGMVRSFDVASVAATAKFLASGAQPMASVEELRAVEVPVMVLPGIDPEHPAEIAALYTSHLKRALEVSQTAEDMIEQIAAFSSGLD